MVHIGIIDYGICNITSVENVFRFLKARISIIRSSEQITQCSGIVLPGVGSFAKGMDNLKRLGFVPAIKNFALSGRPILGICLGMQLLMSKGFEYGNTEGLGLLDGEVVPLGADKPNGQEFHIGWSPVEQTGISSLINQHGIYYFNHGMVVNPHDSSIVTGTFKCGKNYPALIEKENIKGVQFHPEKSSQDGLKILNNFLNLSRDTQWPLSA